MTYFIYRFFIHFQLIQSNRLLTFPIVSVAKVHVLFQESKHGRQCFTMVGGRTNAENSMQGLMELLDLLY